MDISLDDLLEKKGEYDGKIIFLKAVPISQGGNALLSYARLLDPAYCIVVYSPERGDLLSCIMERPESNPVLFAEAEALVAAAITLKKPICFKGTYDAEKNWFRTDTIEGFCESRGSRLSYRRL